MAALWTYPWTMAADGLEEACESVASYGLEELNVSAHYHSVRSMHPRHPDSLFYQTPGGCHFTPSSHRFHDTAIDPPVVSVDGFEDPLAEITTVAHDHGLRVNGWTVCLHNSNLGASNPAYRIESAFGDAHDHSLCPSHPDVRAYFAAVVDAQIERGVDEIHLESIGFPSVFHGHGRDYGHDKRQVLTSETETALLSQCFCEGCRAAAADHDVDLERAQACVREILEASFADPHTDPDALEDLVRADDDLRELFDFRASVIEVFVEGLATAAGSTPLNYYVMESLGGFSPTEIWPSGVRLDSLESFLDRVTALCYVSDPVIAQERIEATRAAVDLPVDVGVTLDPSRIESASDLAALVGAIDHSTESDERVFFYHHGLLTESQLSWVDAALE